jgi:hypothetical protein
MAVYREFDPISTGEFHDRSAATAAAVKTQYRAMQLQREMRHHD